MSAPDRAVLERRVTEALDAIPIVTLAHYPTPIEELPELRRVLGGGPRLLIKRDDAISFGFGGNKVRKLEVVAAQAAAEGADALITAGGVQSNHARVTAATAAKLGLKCILVVNGSKREPPTANALLDKLLGAEVVHVSTRSERAKQMEEAAATLRRKGRRPFVIPIGASTPTGALGFVLAVKEMLGQIPPPDVIVHSTSSGGTQAGLVAGCELFGLATRVVGVSADDPADVIQAVVRSLISGVAERLGVQTTTIERLDGVEIDDSQVGEGYGLSTPASREALDLTARSEAIFLDPTYTAKAMAGLIAGVRTRRFTADQTILFWHTGGQVGLFA